jgi:hypothetical protein
MDRLLIAAGVVAAAVGVAGVLRRRRPEPPTQARWPVPAQLDRGDFERPDAPWLIVVFSSASCLSWWLLGVFSAACCVLCSVVLYMALGLATTEGAVQDVDVQGRPDLHRRYRIDAVPVTVVADHEGVTRASFVGAPSATDLWAVVAELRGH